MRYRRTARCKGRKALFAGSSDRQAMRRAMPSLQNQVFSIPATGEELGRRSRARPFSLSARDVRAGSSYQFLTTASTSRSSGVSTAGASGCWANRRVLLTIDCFIGFYPADASLSRRQSGPPQPMSSGALRRGWWARWKPAWMIKTSRERLPDQLRHPPRLGSLDMECLALHCGFLAFSLNLSRENCSGRCWGWFRRYRRRLSIRRRLSDRYKPIEPRISPEALLIGASRPRRIESRLEPVR